MVAQTKGRILSFYIHVQDFAVKTNTSEYTTHVRMSPQGKRAPEHSTRFPHVAHARLAQQAIYADRGAFVYVSFALTSTLKLNIPLCSGGTTCLTLLVSCSIASSWSLAETYSSLVAPSFASTCRSWEADKKTPGPCLRACFANCLEPLGPGCFLS